MAAIGDVPLGREGAARRHRGAKQSEVCFPDIDAMHLLQKITGEIEARIEARFALRGAMGSREEAGAYAHSCRPRHIRSESRREAGSKRRMRYGSAGHSCDGLRLKSAMVITADAEGLLMHTPAMEWPSSGRGAISVRSPQPIR